MMAEPTSGSLLRMRTGNENTKKSIAWQASTSEPWIEISATSGTTPNTLTDGEYARAS